MKCSTCRKIEVEMDTTWDRFRMFFFHLFKNDIIDLSQDKFIQGFGDGYKVGCAHTEENQKRIKEMYEVH